MQDEIKVSEGYQPAHQFISFVEGSASEAPDPSSYPLQVLEADHNLNHLDGGDPTDGFAPWVTDILVYPSSEYWEGLLQDGRVRPYVDISISSYNTLRIPSAIHNYDLYVDSATIYENLTIHGSTSFSGQISVSGEIELDSVSSDNFSISNDGDIITSGKISGTINGKALVLSKSGSFTCSEAETGAIYHCNPSGDILATLPAVVQNGTAFTIINVTNDSKVTIVGLSNARGNILAEQYSSATVYYQSGWYAFGDLV